MIILTIYDLKAAFLGKQLTDPFYTTPIPTVGISNLCTSMLQKTNSYIL